MIVQSGFNSASASACSIKKEPASGASPFGNQDGIMKIWRGEVFISFYFLKVQFYFFKSVSVANEKNDPIEFFMNSLSRA